MCCSEQEGRYLCCKSWHLWKAWEKLVVSPIPPSACGFLHSIRARFNVYQLPLTAKGHHRLAFTLPWMVHILLRRIISMENQLPSGNCQVARQAGTWSRIMIKSDYYIEGTALQGYERDHALPRAYRQYFRQPLTRAGTRNPHSANGLELAVNTNSAPSHLFRRQYYSDSRLAIAWKSRSMLECASADIRGTTVFSYLFNTWLPYRPASCIPSQSSQN